MIWVNIAESVTRFVEKTLICCLIGVYGTTRTIGRV